MMGQTHRPTGSAWWLGTVLAANTVGAGINPAVALAGAAVAPVFAAGRLSPDADVTWLRHLGHRQATHRPRTAVILTGASLLVWTFGWLLLIAAGGPAYLVWVWGGHWLVWAPVAGWWSHLAGDAVFGRIPLGRRTGALLARVLPGPLKRRMLRRSGGRQAWWFGCGLDTDGLIERGHVYVSKLPRWARWMVRRPERTKSGLHTTVRVLPFAPTTVGMVVLSWLVFAAVVWQWTGGLHTVPVVATR